MAAPPPLLGDGVTDDTLLDVARLLTTAEDLVRLQRTNKRFAAKVFRSPSGGGVPEMLSIPEAAARRWVEEGCNEQERGWVSYRTTESWLDLMHEVEVLRLPLAFGRAHANITLTENGAVATKSADGDDFRTATSKIEMRSGRHYAQFTLAAGWMFFGVIRPDWDVEGGSAAHEDGHCFYTTINGRRRHPGSSYGPHDWEGRQGAQEQGDRIGMLLDLDQGSMAIWKNEVKLGVMQSEGLTGPLCWAAETYEEGDSVRIESAPVPASPTEEELTAAKAWQVANPS